MWAAKASDMVFQTACHTWPISVSGDPGAGGLAQLCAVRCCCAIDTLNVRTSRTRRQRDPPGVYRQTCLIFGNTTDDAHRCEAA